MLEGKYKDLLQYGPQPYHILAALALNVSQGLPQDEQKLAAGLKAAAQIAPCYEGFTDPESGGLTEEAKLALDTLSARKALVEQGDSLVVSALMHDTLFAQTGMYFSQKGKNALKEAALAATAVWFPQVL